MNKFLIIAATLFLFTCKQKDIEPNCLFDGNCIVKSYNNFNNIITAYYTSNNIISRLVISDYYIKDKSYENNIQTDVCQIKKLNYQLFNGHIEYEYNAKNQLIKVSRFLNEKLQDYSIIEYGINNFPIKLSYFEILLFDVSGLADNTLQLSEEVILENDNKNITSCSHFKIDIEDTKKIYYQDYFFYDNYENNFEQIELLNFSHPKSIPLVFSKNNLISKKRTDLNNKTTETNYKAVYDIQNRIIESPLFGKDIIWECN